MARRRGRRYAYGRTSTDPTRWPRRWTCAPRYDEIGRDVMEGSSPRSALQELLRRGLEQRRGLDDLTRDVWRRRARLRRDNRLDGTLQEVRELLRRALEAERTALGRETLRRCPVPRDAARRTAADTGGAVRELDSYDWRSAEAREAYRRSGFARLGALDQRFAGMKQRCRT